MERIEKYFFVDEENKVVLPKDGKRFGIVGIYTGNEREGFKEGDLILTSAVEKIEDGCVYTVDGSTFELGEKHPDLIDLENAKEIGIPIVRWWEMIPGKKPIFSGYNEKKEYVRGFVTDQTGNFVTLDGTKKIFVIWTEPFPLFKNQLRKCCSEKYEESWFYPDSRPIIFVK